MYIIVKGIIDHRMPEQGPAHLGGGDNSLDLAPG